MSPELPRRAMIPIDAGTRVRFLRSERPPLEYAVTLEIRDGDAWTTVRLWDNAEGVDEHHEHPYTRRDGKQPPIIRSVRDVNEAMASAIRAARTQREAFVADWRRES